MKSELLDLLPLALFILLINVVILVVVGDNRDTNCTSSDILTDPKNWIFLLAYYSFFCFYIVVKTGQFNCTILNRV